MAIRATFTTPSYPSLVQMYSDYHLDLKLIADGIYSTDNFVEGEDLLFSFSFFFPHF